MDERELAAQLRAPKGVTGVKVGEMMNKGNTNFYNQLPELLEKEHFSNVLEIGMGAGLHCRNICDTMDIHNYVGLDYSSTMVSEARKNNIEQQNVQFFQADAALMPFDSDAFELVFTINTVYFFESLAAVFNEAHRVLKPKGKFVVGKRTKENLETLNAFTQFGFNKLSKEEVIECALACSFQLTVQQTYPDPPFEWDGFPVQLHSEYLVFEKR